MLKRPAQTTTSASPPVVIAPVAVNIAELEPGLVVQRCPISRLGQPASASPACVARPPTYRGRIQSRRAGHLHVVLGCALDPPPPLRCGLASRPSKLDHPLHGRPSRQSRSSADRNLVSATPAWPRWAREEVREASLACISPRMAHLLNVLSELGCVPQPRNRRRDWPFWRPLSKERLRSCAGLSVFGVLRLWRGGCVADLQSSSL